MRDIISTITEAQDKGEKMLMDICQMWADLEYDPEMLKDTKKYKAIEKFWKWARKNDDGESSLEDTPQYKEFMAAINESYEIDESKVDTIERKLITALKKAIDGMLFDADAEAYGTIIAALSNTQIVDYSVINKLEELNDEFRTAYENEA